MPQPLSRRLAGLFRSKADLTSVKALEKAGVRSVNVLDLRRLEQIVGDAMESALHEALVAGGSAEHAATGAQLEFLRRLGLEGRLAERTGELDAERAELAGSLEKLNTVLDQSKAELAQHKAEQRRGALDDLRARLDLLLDETFARFVALQEEGLALTSSRPPLRAALLALLEGALLAGGGTVAAVEDSAHVDRLERRVKKLHVQLLETQELLARTREEQEAQVAATARAARDGRTGVAAITAPSSDHSDRKALMREIFAHNLELRRTLGDPDAATRPVQRTDPETR